MFSVIQSGHAVYTQSHLTEPGTNLVQVIAVVLYTEAYSQFIGGVISDCMLKSFQHM